VAGILLAAAGGCLVTLYKPGPAPKAHRDPPAIHAVAGSDRTSGPGTS